MTTVTRMVPLKSLLLEHKFFHNPRSKSGMTDEELLALGTDIKRNGLLEFPKVQKITFNNVVQDLLWDGQRRVLGMMKVFPPDHEIEVIDRTEEPLELNTEIGDALLFDALRTTNRQELSSHELANVAYNMRDRGHSLAKIGAAIGRDASWVSKILKARDNASPKLVSAWETGAITDEMFKDLAETSPKEQSQALESVLQARSEGDAGEARTRAKEASLKAKAQKAPKTEDKAEAKTDDKADKPAKTEAKPNGKNGHKPVVAGDQQDMWSKPPTVKPSRPPMALLEDIVKMADQRPPTQDYAKGVIDALRFATGAIEQDKLGKSWKAYIDRLSGTPSKKKARAVPKKKSKPAKKSGKKK